MKHRRTPRPKARPLRPRRAPAPRPQPPQPAAAPGGDTDPLADARIRPLLERYCRLAGVKQAALGPDHSELSFPQAERPFFRDRASLRVAFSLDALERDPDAEIAVLGSPFLAQLLEAIRARAARLSLGLIAPAAASDPSSPPVPLSLRESGDHRGVDLTIPVRDGVAKAQKTHVAVHPVGERWRVANDPDGIADLVIRVLALAPERVVLEATGGIEVPAVAAHNRPVGRRPAG